MKTPDFSNHFVHLNQSQSSLYVEYANCVGPPNHQCQMCFIYYQPGNTGPQKSRIGTDLNSTPLIQLTVILQISDLPPSNQQPMNWTEFPSYILFIFQESGSLRYTSQYRRKGLLPLPRWFLHVIPKNKNHCHFLSQAFLLCWHYVGQK